MKIKINSLFVLSISVLLMLIQSCTKTQIVDYDKPAANKILEYRVTNAQQRLLGAIDQVNNRIIVYVPYYLGIDYLVSEISMDEGAKLLDSLGNVINLDGGLAPVHLGDTVKYTVKSSDNISRTYMLIQKILPHPDPLSVRYKGLPGDTSSIEKAVYGRFNILGNLESTSMNAKFTFTDRKTGKVYHNFFLVNSVVPGSQQYTMTIDISPYAQAGEFDVMMEHQGRTAFLPKLRLKYKRPTHGLFSSTASYAPGDTITFIAQGSNTNDAYNGVFVGLERVYLKLRKEYLKVPEGFSDSFYDKELQLNIASWDRKQVKAIFPDIPSGQYLNTNSVASDSNRGFVINYSGFGFYFDFNEETGWGSNNLIATSASRFQVKARP